MSEMSQLNKVNSLFFLAVLDLNLFFFFKKKNFTCDNVDCIKSTLI